MHNEAKDIMNTSSMGLGMWIFWLVLIAVVVLVIKMLVSSDSGASSLSRDTPMKILEKRYARGEINKQEFESMKKDLEKQ